MLVMEGHHLLLLKLGMRGVRIDSLDYISSKKHVIYLHKVHVTVRESCMNAHA